MMRIERLAAIFAASLLAATLAEPAFAQAVRTNPGFTRNSLPRNDDGSSGPFNSGFALNFFGRTYNSLYVNNNGNITFGGPLASFTPAGLVGSSVPIVAAFWADVDTTAPGSSVVTYGTDTVNGRLAVGANYINVGYYRARADKLNSFQLILIDRSDTGAGNFDIEFNYNRIVWETGDASGGSNGLGGTSAAVGYSNGSGTAAGSFQLPGSQVPGSFLDSNSNGLIRRTLNSNNVLGRLIFPVRGGQVISGATLTSISPNSAQAFSNSVQLQANGSNFVSGASVRWTFSGQTTSLQTQFQSASLLQATIPASLLTSPGTADVSVVNPGNALSNSLPFTITAPVVPLSFTGLSATSVPTQSTSGGLALNTPLSFPVSGTVTLTFVANAAGVTPGYRDPALQFATGGTTFGFTILAGSTTLSLPAIQQGTVAGDIIAAVTSLVANNLNVLPSPPPGRSVSVPRLPPVIVANTVRITGRSATGFSVELDGYSTTRDLASATFTFQAASGTELVGGPFTVSLSSVAPAWFADSAGLANGSRFHLIVPFSYSGDVGALGSVSVTLTNSQGTSAAETGS